MQSLGTLLAKKRWGTITSQEEIEMVIARKKKDELSKEKRIETLKRTTEERRKKNPEIMREIGKKGALKRWSK